MISVKSLIKRWREKKSDSSFRHISLSRLSAILAFRKSSIDDDQWDFGEHQKYNLKQSPVLDFEEGYDESGSIINSSAYHSCPSLSSCSPKLGCTRTVYSSASGTKRMQLNTDGCGHREELLIDQNFTIFEEESNLSYDNIVIAAARSAQNARNGRCRTLSLYSDAGPSSEVTAHQSPGNAVDQLALRSPLQSLFQPPTSRDSLGELNKAFTALLPSLGIEASAFFEDDDVLYSISVKERQSSDQSAEELLECQPIFSSDSKISSLDLNVPGNSRVPSICCRRASPMKLRLPSLRSCLSDSKMSAITPLSPFTSDISIDFSANGSYSTSLTSSNTSDRFDQYATEDPNIIDSDRASERHNSSLQFPLPPSSPVSSCTSPYSYDSSLFSRSCPGEYLNLGRVPTLQSNDRKETGHGYRGVALRMGGLTSSDVVNRNDHVSNEQEEFPKPDLRYSLVHSYEAAEVQWGYAI